MNRDRTLLLAALAVVVAACSAPPPPVVVPPQGEARFLVDPRTGWSATVSPATDRAFEAAWRYILSGDYTTARQRLNSLRAKSGDYPPATLAEAAIAMREARIEDARVIAAQLAAQHPTYTAANIYLAEIDLADNQIRSAYDRYRAIAAQPDAPPTVSDRLGELQTRLFDQLYGAATRAGDAEAVRLLREALTINPEATAARILLAERLVAQQRYDDARRELDPLLGSGEADRAEVQEALAEIDVGKGRYQQAINRYERLTRRDTEGRYVRRLQEIKEKFAQENMPPQFSRALEAESITRADLAVLLYWKLTAIRFAQDVPAPPIAIDVADVPGRDELIRAIALGIFQVDPVTRRVNPFTAVTTASLARTAARVLAIRGAPCARNVPSDRVLSACGIADPTLAGPETAVSGRVAATFIEQIDRALR